MINLSNNDFHQLIRKIDNQLINENIPISSRPLRACSYISAQLKESIPLINKSSLDYPVTNENIATHINQWYDNMYGDLLLIDMSPGSYFTYFRGTIFEVKFPRILGTVNFKIDRDLEKYKKDVISNEIPNFNVLNSILKIRQGFINTLSDKELECFFVEYCRNYFSITSFQNYLQKYQYFIEAHEDYKQAVSVLRLESTNFGLSKWSSLQFAEKILKGLILTKDDNVDKTHELRELNKQFYCLFNLKFDDEIIKGLNCSASVRYDNTMCNRNDAFSSHQKSLLFLNQIIGILT